MSAINSFVVLDTGPLGLISNPKASPENDACRVWLDNLIAKGRRVAVPEVAGYEARRELLRANKTIGIERMLLIFTHKWLPLCIYMRPASSDIRTYLI